MHTSVHLRVLVLPFLLLLFGAATSIATVVNAPLEIKQVSVEENAVALEWSGGTSPYSVELSTGLGDWSTALETNKRTALVEVPGGSSGAMYVRVKGSAAPKLGDYLGQLRVAEGSSGGRLALHRLKSLWDFYLPGDAEPSQVPAEYFQQLVMRITYRAGNDLAYFTGTLSDLPEAEVQVKDREINVSWRFDEGELVRRYSLTMVFRYAIRTRRSGQIDLSDPGYRLECAYSEDQPEFLDGAPSDSFSERVNTRTDVVGLVQFYEGHVASWAEPEYDQQFAGVRFATSFSLGCPLRRGEPDCGEVLMLKSWDSTTLSGITTEPVTVTDRFSQTYEPWIDNIAHSFWIEPELIPGISDATLDELRDQDIRFIVVANIKSSFFLGEPRVRVIGFDNVPRDYP